MRTRGSARRRPRSRRCRSSSRATLGAGATPAPAPDLAAELDRLNDAYEARFGFRYCVFVAGRSRVALLPELVAALEADRDAELARALDAVVDIARDRYATMTSAAREASR